MMFMKIIFSFVLISVGVVYVKVDAQCANLLAGYYGCKNPNTSLDDAFYQSQLNGITTFNAAMDKYKAIFIELDWNTCSNALCSCVKTNELLAKMNYGAFFVNSNYFTDMVNILSAVRNNYTRNPYPLPITTSIYSFPTFYQFCYNYEFGIVDLYHNNETNNCLYKFFMGSDACFTHISNVINITDIINNPTSYENYLKCSIGLASSCSVEIKRDIVFNFLSYSPSMIKNGLLTYINSLISSGEEEAKNATVVWMTGDPHMSSVMKGFETCNFNTTLVCVQSDNVTVNCTGAKISSSTSFTVLSEIKIRFTKASQSSDFIAGQTSFPTSLSNGQTTLQDSNGNNWLKLTTFNTRNLIVITDFNSNMVISMGKWGNNYFMVIQAPKLAYKQGGILYDGCPLVYRANRLTASRKKRAASEAATACSSNTQQSGSSLISSSNLYDACVSDVTATGDVSFATIYKSTLDAYSEVKTAYTAAFGTTSGSAKLASTFSFILIAICVSLFKYF